jgi:hypothetical protein
MQKMVNRFNIILILLIITTISLCSSFAIAQGHPGGDPNGSGEQTGTITYPGPKLAVGATWENTESDAFEGLRITQIDFILTWTDDEGSDSEPDTFSLQADDDNNDPKSGSSSNGMVSVSFDEGDLNNVWNMVVRCDASGPTPDPLGPIGIITQDNPDPGNTFTLTVTYSYTEGSSGPGGPPANVVAVLNSPIFKIHIALMIASTYLFLFTGIFAGVLLFTRRRWADENSAPKKFLTKPTLMIFLAILAFLAFFIASVPIGMWVAGMWYGWSKAWTGFPAMWNPEAWSFTNADNVSFIVLLLWAIPLYLNRAQIVRSKWYKKFFGWSSFLMRRAEKAPKPRLGNKELAIMYFLMGVFVFLVFMVQPHGSG